MIRGLEIGCQSISDPTLPSVEQIKNSYPVKEIREHMKEYRSGRRKYIHKQSLLFIELLKKSEKHRIIYLILSDIYTIFRPIGASFRSWVHRNAHV